VHRRAIDRTVELATAHAAEDEVFASRRIQVASWVLAGVFGLSLLIVLALAVAIVRGVLGQVNRAVDAVSRIAEGDLSGEIDAAGTNEIARVLRSLAEMQRRLAEVVKRVTGTAVELASAAEELSATTTQMAGTNEQVSGQSQSVAAASEQMGATVGTVAQNTLAVSQASGEAHRVAADGSRVVSDAIAALTETAVVVQDSADTVTALGQQSEDIGRVIEVIEDIADQTNLLALNAAIEAARAGEHGRGFAVVADEVRKLAEKTVQATQEISRTITSIQHESRNAVQSMVRGKETVERGSSLGARAAEAIQAIEKSIGAAFGQNQEIAAATEQLSASIAEVVGSIEHISRSVTENASAARGVAEAAASVAQKADELRSITEIFRT